MEQNNKAINPMEYGELYPTFNIEAKAGSNINDQNNDGFNNKRIVKDATMMTYDDLKLADSSSSSNSDNSDNDNQSIKQYLTAKGPPTSLNKPNAQQKQRGTIKSTKLDS